LALDSESTRAAHPHPELGVSQELHYPIGERLRCSGWDEKSGLTVYNNFGISAHTRYDDRETVIH
jgi:hypothetical protein